MEMKESNHSDVEITDIQNNLYSFLIEGLRDIENGDTYSFEEGMEILTFSWQEILHF